MNSISSCTVFTLFWVYNLKEVGKISQRKWEGLRCEEEAGIHRIGNSHKSESRKKGVNHN